MDEQQVIAFADQAKVKLTEPLLGRCVDGRYERDNLPMVAKPGGDAGDAMAVYGALNLLNATLPDSEVLAAVEQTVGGVGNFQFHTDEHAEHDQAGTGMGCGHIKKAKLEPEAYGLTQMQIDNLASQLPALLSEGAHQEVLQGDHGEQATIVVESDDYGLKPLVRGENGVQEAFIYHRTKHQEQLAELAKVLQEKIAATGKAVEISEVQKALDDAFGKQLAATLERLAKGLPVYTVLIDSAGQVTVKK